MRWALALLAGCGRVGFGAVTDGAVGDGSADAEVPFVEAVGAPDPGFGGDGDIIIHDGTNEVRAYAVVPRGDGYLVVGVHQSATATFGLFAYQSTGEPDTTFGTAGIKTVGPTGNDFAYGAVRLDADRVAMVGDGDDAGGTLDDITVGVVNPISGQLDQTFGTGGFVRVNVQADDTGVRAAVVDSSIVTCGTAAYTQLDSHFVLVRTDLHGALVTTWGTGGVVVDDLAGTATPDNCYAVMRLGDRVIAAGDSDDRLAVVAYDQLGNRDVFGTNGVFTLPTSFSGALGLAELEGDAIVVGEDGGAGIVIRLDSEGSPRVTFGGSGRIPVPEVDTISAVAIQPNGKIVVAGWRQDTAVVLRILGDGKRDASFGTAGLVEIPHAGVEVQAMMLEPSGRIVIAGFGRPQAPHTGFLARLR